MDRNDPDWLHQRRPSWPPHDQRRRSDNPFAPLAKMLDENRGVAAAATLGLGAIAGLAAYTLLGPKPPRPEQRPAPRRIADDAPGRTAKKADFGGYKVAGRSVTINKPRAEIYAFWRDFSNLAKFMENIESAREVEPGISEWQIRAPLGMTMKVRSRIVNDREGEQIAWRSTPDSQIETEGKVTFLDAPGGRGTIVEAHVAYKPPMGALGQAVAKVFSAEPSIQSRRDLKRLKMLLETGEIATNANRRKDGGKFQQQPERVQATLPLHAQTA